MRKIAALILPVRSDPNFEAKRNVARQAAGDVGWVVAMPEYGDGSGSERRIVESWLLNADIVIADLSQERPSCYFELGFAEALCKRITVIASVGTEIHQTGYRDEVRFFCGPDQYRALIAAALDAATASQSGSSV